MSTLLHYTIQILLWSTRVTPGTADMSEISMRMSSATMSGNLCLNRYGNDLYDNDTVNNVSGNWGESDIAPATNMKSRGFPKMRSCFHTRERVTSKLLFESRALACTRKNKRP